MKRARGFTLLEVMIAMAILAGALTWLVVGVSRNIKAENHAKLMTTANFLAREKMVDLEDDLYDKGFGEFEKEQAGAFDDKGFSRFTWKAIVDKVELPSAEQLQTVLSNAQQARQTLQGGGGDSTTSGAGGLGRRSSSNPLSAGAGAISSQFGIIKDVLEQAHPPRHRQGRLDRRAHAHGGRARRLLHRRAARRSGDPDRQRGGGRRRRGRGGRGRQRPVAARAAPAEATR